MHIPTVSVLRHGKVKNAILPKAVASNHTWEHLTAATSMPRNIHQQQMMVTRTQSKTRSAQCSVVVSGGAAPSVVAARSSTMKASLSVEGPRPLSMLRMDNLISCSMCAPKCCPVCATRCCRAMLKICADDRYRPLLRLDAMAWTNEMVIGRGSIFHEAANFVQSSHLESLVFVLLGTGPARGSGWPFVASPVAAAMAPMMGWNHVR